MRATHLGVHLQRSLFQQRLCEFLGFLFLHALQLQLNHLPFPLPLQLRHSPLLLLLRPPRSLQLSGAFLFVSPCSQLCQKFHTAGGQSTV